MNVGVSTAVAGAPATLDIPVTNPGVVSGAPNIRPGEASGVPWKREVASGVPHKAPSPKLKVPEDGEESFAGLLRVASGRADIPSTQAAITFKPAALSFSSLAGTWFHNESKECDFGRVQDRAASTLLFDPERTDDSVHPTVPKHQGRKSADDLHMLQCALALARGKQDELGGTSRGGGRISSRTFSINSSSVLPSAFRSLH